ncbi:hypothetical protein [Variovorax sp. dw_308]|uniref:hypothetical protein n=1 Tax=Variovorax sp. dw_308 TaxID=2721546 RepID=UPI001C497B7C|nr:hypothetical protein [Variovorax sp. dw_308]
MTPLRIQLAAAIAAALLATATIASAQDSTAQPALHTLGEHPAILVKRQVPQIDPNTFILMHPAGLFVIAGPTQTEDQPAVIAARTPPQVANEGSTAGTALRRPDLSVAVAVSASEH